MSNVCYMLINERPNIDHFAPRISVFVIAFTGSRLLLFLVCGA